MAAGGAPARRYPIAGTTPIPYTTNPWQLLASDLSLFLKHAWTLLFIVWPLTPFNSGPLDELYPSAANLFDIFVHLILFVAQLAFLISIPVALLTPIVPFSLAVAYIVGFVVANNYICLWLLNGNNPTLESSVDLSDFETHDDEKWIFLNGISIGHHWLQSNIDRLAYSFRRPVLGVHNPTAGIVFDVLQCLIQRDFTYATQDVRDAYSEIKKALSDPQKTKVVFIIHSQGGIEGGLVCDWLLADVSGHLLKKLEVYSFGSAANHFNNPRPEATEHQDEIKNYEYGIFKHIEHYANGLDFVSRWGVLHFDSWATDAGKTNRYRGRVFERYGTKGHLLVQHYLDYMFPLVDPQHPIKGIKENNDFMDSIADVERWGPEIADGGVTFDAELEKHQDILPPGPLEVVDPDRKRAIIRNLTAPPFGLYHELVSNYSLLWQYRNGRSPRD